MDEPFDCVVYAAAIWAGFAAVENVLYAAQDLSQGGTALPLIAMRAALCSTGHTAWGVIVGAYVGMAMFGQGNRVAWALQGLGIAIALHTFYDGLLFTLDEGASIQNLFWALAVDGVTLVLAVLIVRRMSRIQRFSQAEGQDLMLQVRLMRRYRPDRSQGMEQMAKGLGVLGLVQILLFLFFASTTYFSAMLVASSEWVGVPAGLVTGGLAFATWRIARLTEGTKSSGLPLGLALGIAVLVRPDHLLLGARFMTLIVGVRFLTDHLEGDVYFRTTRPRQNLDRARVQVSFLDSLDELGEDLERRLRGFR